MARFIRTVFGVTPTYAYHTRPAWVIEPCYYWGSL